MWKINAPDLGSYSALQQFKNYDFIDLTKIGMLGHSMGTAAIQEGAYLAYAKWRQPILQPMLKRLRQAPMKQPLLTQPTAQR